MGHRTRGRSHTTWDDFLVGVVGLVLAAALGTVAATVALSGHHVAAVLLAVVALGFAVPALVQAVGELVGIALLVGTLAAFVLTLPALLISPALRRRAREHWTATRR
ncbi:hypothetical protein ACTD5D_07680 [Nocardia takedensis]|uniref:hypothetical protein n=1 Tax=Nocardia takedensis TaxID=259390 RepID=UPI0003177935|nr:hypothetical protein [Nocardia takedensis]